MSRRPTWRTRVHRIFFSGVYLRGIWVAVIVVAVLAAFAVALGVGVASLERASCSQTGNEYGLPSHYRFLSGCYVTLPSGRNISPDNIKAVEVGRGRP